MEKFRQFFAGLSPDRYCIGCLARISETPEDEVRNGLQALSDSLEMQIGECHNCRERSQTYRRRPFLPDRACAECANPILPTDNKTTIQNVPYHSACWDRKTQKAMPDDAACAACGKGVRAGADVREGDKRFHLDCYLAFKRRSSSSPGPAT
jgi:uncharacterized protein with PIN domain